MKEMNPLAQQLQLTPVEIFLAHKTGYIIRGDSKYLLIRDDTNDFLEGPSTDAEIKLWGALADFCTGVLRYQHEM